MCLAVPLKIISIDGADALCQSGGVKRAVRLDFLPDAKVGDYVLSHAGFAIELLDEQRAQENLSAIAEVMESLK